MPGMTMPAKLLKPQDVADLLGISRAYAYELIEKSAIETVRVGRCVRVTHEALEAYIPRSTTPAPMARK